MDVQQLWLLMCQQDYSLAPWRTYTVFINICLKEDADFEQSPIKETSLIFPTSENSWQHTNRKTSKWHMFACNWSNKRKQTSYCDTLHGGRGNPFLCLSKFVEIKQKSWQRYPKTLIDTMRSKFLKTAGVYIYICDTSHMTIYIYICFRNVEACT